MCREWAGVPCSPEVLVPAPLRSQWVPECLALGWLESPVPPGQLGTPGPFPGLWANSFGKKKSAGGTPFPLWGPLSFSSH